MGSYTCHLRVEGERATVTLLGLDDYEAAGGVYADGGNGGEDAVALDPATAPPREEADGQPTAAHLAAMRAAGRAAFVAALAVEEDGGLGAGAVLAALGAADAWCDSAQGVYLLADWPEALPYVARFLDTGP